MPAAHRWIRVAVLVSLVAGCKSPATAPSPNAQERVNELLWRFQTKQALSGFVGVSPALCIASSASGELCEWRAGDREAGWQAMAGASGYDDRLNLICELPTSGAPRARDACSVHPRRSNRYSWQLPNAAPSRNAPAPGNTRADVKKRYREQVDRWMEEADTLVGLSRLMGAVPDPCQASSEREQACTWRTTSHTFGHGTLVIWIDASKGKKIRLRCVLPSDGSPRAPGSCSAEIGA